MVIKACDDVIKWTNFPHYWPFVQGIHLSLVNSPYKGQWRRALMFSLIYAWINGWVNNHEAGDLRRHHAHYDFIVWKFWPKHILIFKLEWSIISLQCYDFINLLCNHLKLRILIMPTFSWLVALEVVIMTTSSTTSDNRVGIMMMQVSVMVPNPQQLTAAKCTDSPCWLAWFSGCMSPTPDVCMTSWLCFKIWRSFFWWMALYMWQRRFWKCSCLICSLVWFSGEYHES